MGPRDQLTDEVMFQCGEAKIANESIKVLVLGEDFPSNRNNTMRVKYTNFIQSSVLVRHVSMD